MQTLTVSNYLRTTWSLAAEMAPYLLLGFLMAGLLRSVFSVDWVQRHLGQRGTLAIFKAVLVGIPLPLCSCGVLPVAAGMRAQGAQRGAVAAFTASTPQTGIDSIAATVGMLGAPFAAIRVLLAFINGMVAGWVVQRWGDPRQRPDAAAAAPAPAAQSGCCCGGGSAAAVTPAPATAAPAAAASAPACCGTTQRPGLREGMRFGLLTLPQSLSLALLAGLLLAGLIASIAPQDFFNHFPGGRLGVYLGVSLLALPMYICSTGSIPMAFSFLAAGMSPGAVLIFLIAGPASSIASVTALWKILGGRATIGYVVSITLTAWAAALVVDFSGTALLMPGNLHCHLESIGWFKHASAVVLLGLLILPRLRRIP